MVKRENPRKYIVAILPKSLRSVGFYQDDMSIKGKKIWVNNEPAKFNYTIEYKPDDYCNMARGACGVFDATEYTETLPNGVRHSIIEMADNAPYDNTREFTVPENHLFFMGDNRDNSSDSRAEVGFVPRDNVLGKVWFIWYSHNYYAPMPAIWTWGNKMRWDRFGMGIK
ncbi:MAG: signal peptidase I [Alphaproteobacteria bacterium]|nr:signal peptidase I [Alphaproteobacteria bacterium]